MSKISWAYLVAIVGIVIAAVNLVFTHFEAGFLNAVFQIPTDAARDADRLVANLALSLVGMFAATLLGCFLLLADSRESMANESRELREGFTKSKTDFATEFSALRSTVLSLPQTRAFSALVTSDEGLAYLVRNLPDAKTIYNTRLTSASTNLPHSGVSHQSTEWEKALADSLDKGAHVYEVVTRAWEAECDALSKGHSAYNCSVIDMAMPSFLNFIVIEYKSGQDREVLFGWLSTTNGGFDNNCFRTTEPRIVELFKDWHLALRGGGKP